MSRGVHEALFEDGAAPDATGVVFGERAGVGLVGAWAWARVELGPVVSESVFFGSKRN